MFRYILHSSEVMIWGLNRAERQPCWYSYFKMRLQWRKTGTVSVKYTLLKDTSHATVQCSPMHSALHTLYIYGATAMTESPRAGTVFVKYILLTDVNGCPSAPSPAPTATVAWDLLKWKMCAADICHRGVLTLLEWPTFARTASQKQSASVGDKLNFPLAPIAWQWCWYWTL